ncbi:DNA mismatch repair protein MutS [Bartonella sp. TP]|uniref:DNA mismatch repair protein MutS n=1 Tax=Bartonella sp. TP TaxID=3057550 RepID=UPI0025B13B43|nr:DNA mismatch repair protein MutS [Bartonella sp. TP]WJW80431.1 DNA mismatch repair protein MutS [Bartonella sp. TP]
MSAPDIKQATPMMQQYIEIKAAYKDYLLLYRLGDFYELFFEDAAIASKALGLTLTKRGKHLGEDIEMCGVPAHSCEPYLHKLIEQGYQVAICEQTEDPKTAKLRGPKTVVKRAVTRLLTPGTITEDNLLDPTSANYLVSFAIYEEDGKKNYAIAYMDFSTGLFRAKLTEPIRILSDLMGLEPKELLLAESLRDCPITSDPMDSYVFNNVNFMRNIAHYQSDTSFNLYEAINKLKTYYNIADENAFANFLPAQLCAMGAIIAYIEKTQIENRPVLAFPVAEDNEQYLYIDAATRQNLELFKTLSGSANGSLLRCLDYTTTNGGSRLLADRLMHPLKDIDIINKRLDTVGWLISDAKLCQNLQTAIKNAADGERALARISNFRATPHDLGAIQNILEVAANVMEVLGTSMLPSELSHATQKLRNIPPKLKHVLDRALTVELPTHKRDGNFIAQNYNTDLDLARRMRDESQQIIKNLQQQYIKQTSIKNLKLKHNNILGYFIEITANQASLIEAYNQEHGQKFIHRQTTANAMRFTSEELRATEHNIVTAADRALELELDIFNQLCNMILDHDRQIREVAQALNIFDLSCALAHLACSHNYCRPILDDSLNFNITKGRHPVVEQALKKQGHKNFIANNCDLSPQNAQQKQGSLWLLTGPNMGGKSTFLRQNALIVIMAQIGSFVPAEKAHIGVVDKLFSRVGASDDLSQGRSTFMVEMVETATILKQSSKQSLVILDEIGRGTATYDGLSIAQASAEYLHNHNKCRAIFATHFHELTALEQQLSNLVNVTMKVVEWRNEVVFLHEISKGSANRSYGIHVARLSGLPEEVLQRASEILHELETRKTPYIEPNKEKSQEQLLDAASDKIKTALQQLDADNLSPREALNAVYQLKNLLNKSI